MPSTNLSESMEERVIYRQRFQGARLDFRGRATFLRYDCCEFVKTEILLDARTESLAFTNCVFEDCNIDRIEPDESRAVVARDNTFKLPIEERRAAFESRLAAALCARRR